MLALILATTAASILARAIVRRRQPATVGAAAPMRTLREHRADRRAYR